jgi:hypothetical protein
MMGALKVVLVVVALVLAVLSIVGVGPSWELAAAVILLGVAIVI